MRYGTQQSTQAKSATKAVITSYPAAGAPTIPANAGRLAWTLYNPIANGIMTLSFDGVLDTVVVDAGGYYEAMNNVANLPVWVKVASAGNVNLTEFV